MLRRIIEWSVGHKLLVVLGTLAVSLGGVWAMITTPVDAIPDLSDAQVIVMTEWPGQAPQLVEDQVTYPISTELLKVPNTKFVRGMSQFGLSAVYVVFEDGTDLYWARSRVLEYMNGVRDKLPEGAMPMLGPDATGVGWVMQYILADTSGTLDLAQLRGLQDFTVRPALTAVPGVAEIATLGGFEKQYQVEVDPAKLLAFDIPIQRVVERCRPPTKTSADGSSRPAAPSTWCERAGGSPASMTSARCLSAPDPEAHPSPSATSRTCRPVRRSAAASQSSTGAARS